MNKKVIAVFLAFAAVSSAFALKIPGASKVVPVAPNTNSGASLDLAMASEKIARMAVASDVATVTFNNAIVSLAFVLASKEEIAKIKETLNAFFAEAKDDEAKAVFGAKIANQVVEAIEKQTEDELKARVKNLSKEQKTAVADSAYNVLWASRSLASIASDSSDLVKEVSADPTASLKIAKDVKVLKNIAAKTPGQLKQAADVATKVMKILKPTGIKVKEPKSESETATKQECVFSPCK
jgi:polyribonucleotide nucleotidyltransferase